jgi:hypothetical protein
MFSGGMDIVLEYRTIPAIINYSLSKRTMNVVNLRVLVLCDSARWTMVFKLRSIYKMILTSCGQRGWSFWESLTSATVKAVHPLVKAFHPLMAGKDTERMVKAIHPLMAGENTERTIPVCHYYTLARAGPRELRIRFRLSVRR